MLLLLCATALLCTLGFWAIARTSLAVMGRLGVDLMTVLLWLGLAEWPNGQPRAKRERLGRLLVDPAPRASA